MIMWTLISAFPSVYAETRWDFHFPHSTLSEIHSAVSTQKRAIGWFFARPPRSANVHSYPLIPDFSKVITALGSAASLAKKSPDHSHLITLLIINTYLPNNSWCEPRRTNFMILASSSIHISRKSSSTWHSMKPFILPESMWGLYPAGTDPLFFRCFNTSFSAAIFEGLFW